MRLVVRDFEPMQDRVHHMIEMARTGAVRYSPQEVGETVDFLEWLLQLNFVLLGYREYELSGHTDEDRAIRAVPGAGWASCPTSAALPSRSRPCSAKLDPDVRRRIEDGDLLVFSKTNAYSTVHRRARMDYIGVRKVNAEGEITGESRLIGLFTSKAYMEPATKTPLLHHKLEQILTAEDLIPGSHDYKEAVELFESFPSDELFSRIGVRVAPTGRGPAAAGEARRDPCPGAQGPLRPLRERGRGAPAGSVQRRRCGSGSSSSSCERFNGSTVDYHLSLGETENARIFFTVHLDPGVQIPEVPYEELDEEVERLARTWDDDLLDALVARVGRQRGAMLAEKWGPRFPNYYKASDRVEPDRR